MLCPICNVDLLITERQGVEIDYCPKCRGIWLDRGEIDKLIERSSTFESRPVREEYRGRREESREPHPYSHPQARYEEHHDHRDEGYHKHKRKSFIEEIFDLD